MEKPSRREMLSAMLITSGAATAALVTKSLAGEHQTINLELLNEPSEFRAFHRQLLNDVRRELNGLRPLSREGIGRALDALEENNIIRDNDKDLLVEGIEFLFNGDSTDDMVSQIISHYNLHIQDVGDVGKVILATEAESAAYAREIQQAEPVSHVIAHDVRGAIDGAAAGARIGGLLGLRIPAAVIGALVGGGAGSIIGYFESSDS